MRKGDKGNGKIGLSSGALVKFLHDNRKMRHSTIQPPYTRFSSKRNLYCDIHHFLVHFRSYKMLDAEQWKNKFSEMYTRILQTLKILMCFEVIFFVKSTLKQRNILLDLKQTQIVSRAEAYPCWVTRYD